MRLLLNLQALQGARKPKHWLSSITSDQFTAQDQTSHITTLLQQVKQLFEAIKKANRHFWPALVRPGSNLEARPMLHGFGDVGQMQVVLRYSYNAWAETEGAIAAVEELLKA